AAAALRRAAVTGDADAVAVVVVLAAARAFSPALWVAAVVVLGLGIVGLPVLAGRVAPAPSGGAPDREGGGLHVLHLAFEDPAMPGSGGGALRTAEIDRRLAAAGHHVTVLTGRYPGAFDRVERHGRGSVAWVHPGVGRGRTRLTRLLAYMAAAFVAARRAGRRHAGDTASAPGPVDLVVEDFFAPISSMAIPAWTRRPVVGVVQWLNAKEKAAQYHVPVHWVERAAVRTHRRIVAVSHGVGAATKALSPRAEVAVIGNGVDPVAFSVPPAPVRERRDVVFVGRLEIAQKGLDLLLDAWALAADRVEGDLLLAGTGPDEAALRERARERGIADRVRFLGWVAGRDKAELVSRARVAAVPSRFETFGIVAAEALAVGTPVVAFDIDCLREVVPADGGVLVPGLDAADYAEALVALVEDEPRRAVTARRGPDLARIHDWDALAATQDAFYRRVAAEGRAPWEAPRVPAGRS
ncbi:glycosyltransferase family 4 protein, partial [Actinomycetospora atypica]